ncbi:MAG: hypothetical protein FH748_01830 [Balneolaceae bacterium]|nr:hypothetical protein [Balneolaceae bacterium]
MEFQGFQNLLPTIVIVVVIAGLGVLSWYSYKKITSIPALSKWGLISLRAAALIILFLLLLNPYFYSSEEVEVKPKIAVFLDNSESVAITKGDYNGRESYNILINELDFDTKDQFNFDYYSIGMNSTEFHPDSLTLDETQTNFSRAVDNILELEDRFKAGVIISDGIITYGKDPSFAVSASSFPVYTIGIGDTSSVKDISVSNVLTNADGYTNTKQLIEAEITQSGFTDQTVVVSLMDGTEVIENQNISFETNVQVKKAVFELELREAGLKQYQIKVNPLDGEWTEANNQKTFSINVLDSKVKILHIAFKVHPDVKMLRSIINEDANNELTTLTWTGGRKFIEEIPEDKDFNLIIVHGLPPRNPALNIIDDLSKTPTILLGLDAIQRSGLPAFNQLRIISSRANRAVQVSINKLLSSDEQAIMELPEFSAEELPALFSPLKATNPEPASKNLFSSTYENIDTNSPVISIMERGNVRRAHINAWGWYRFYQSTNNVHRQLTVDLFTNIVSWTSSDPDNRKLQISPSKQSFTTSEKPGINASLQNESGSSEEDAIIEVRILTDEENSRSFNMQNAGNGNYRLDLPNLSEGLFKFEATARKGNRLIDEQSGEFLVSNTSTELTNTNRNERLLKTIAANTGGNYFNFTQTEAFWDSLRINNISEPQTEIIENYEFPVRSIFWFILVLLLLGSEWLLRKFYSLP